MTDKTESGFESYDSTALEGTFTWRRVGSLGKGSFGEVSVWQNDEPGNDQKIAVKVCFEKNLREYIRYWMREVHVMRRLRHPNVVRALDVPSDVVKQVNSSLPLLAMEFCDGGNVRAYCKLYKKGLPEELLRSFLKDVCSGLRYLHRKHIVHRDLKPDNIVVRHIDSRPVFKITDLGFVEILSPCDATRSFVGTKGYIAPEVINKNRKPRYNYLIDYWSLGITVCEVALKRHPFHDINDLSEKGDAIYARRTVTHGVKYKTELPRSMQCGPKFRRALNQWLRVMLQVCPENRNRHDVNDLSSLDVMLRFLAVTEPETDSIDPLTDRDDREVDEALLQAAPDNELTRFYPC